MRLFLLTLLTLTQVSCVYLKERSFRQTPKAKLYDINAIEIGMSKDEVLSIMGNSYSILFHGYDVVYFDSIDNYSNVTYEYDLRKGLKVGSLRIRFDSTKHVSRVKKPVYRKPLYFNPS